MKKLQFLLPILLGAFVMTACAVDNEQETAVRRATEPKKPAASQDAPVTKNQKLTIIPEKNPETVPTPSGTAASANAYPPPAEPALAPLPVIAPAPSWDNDTWINTDNPLLLEDLRGKVVLLEFWTFG